MKDNDCQSDDQLSFSIFKANTVFKYFQGMDYWKKFQYLGMK